MDHHDEKPPPLINITKQYQRTPSSPASSPPFFEISPHQIESFQNDGYAIFPNVFDRPSVERLNHRLEYVLRGVYDSGVKPDKVPKLVKLPLPKGVDDGNDCNGDGDGDGDGDGTAVNGSKVEENREAIDHGDNNNVVGRIEMESSSSPQSIHHNKNTNANSNKNTTKRKKRIKKETAPLGYSGNKKNIKVMQIINIRKSDTLFAELSNSDLLGYMVSKLMKWSNGARLAQDQVWAKPPGAPPLAYHRDSPYFMFTPNDVATVWIALDDMDNEDLGPLTYVKSSHLWNDGRVGSSQNFFQSNGGMSLLYSAAERSGRISNRNEIEYVSMVGLAAGGLSIHNGRTWHGSNGNRTDAPRRGIGLHYVPVDVRWTVDAVKSTLWKRYVEDVVVDGGDVESIEVDECDFPVVYSNNNQ
mmetsp:Transcript_23446/g.34868  ORF Transcript_23446/g.34868 Transcript_23446/m.34868 type:complete len:414 (+) Transcript_23446:84-1325(+)